MIVGIGTDLVEIARIATVLSRHGDRFRQRVLTPAELAAAPRFANRDAEARWLAKRYAAKEAAAKAFGTGIGTQLSFQDLVVGREPSGRPTLVFAGAGVAARLGVRRAHLSLTDERGHALAFVVLEGD